MLDIRFIICKADAKPIAAGIEPDQSAPENENRHIISKYNIRRIETYQTEMMRLMQWTILRH